MEKTLRQIFVENLKYYRQKKRFSQLALAMEIDKSVNYINGIENNNTFPSVEVIEQIAKVLKIPASKLFEERETPKNAIVFDKAAFMQEISSTLYEKIRDDIACNIEEVLNRY